MVDATDSIAGLLEAQLQFELGRWSEAGSAATLRQEVAGVFELLAEVSLGELVTVEQAVGALERLAGALSDPPEELAVAVQDAVRDGYRWLTEEDGALSDLVPREEYEQLVGAASGATAIRREITRQATTSAVYSRLIAHVLYHGIKNYVLTENVVVRKVPGASSLLRMGQNAVRSASPNMGGNIDRALIAFVDSNVGETIRDSQEFLDGVLDDEMVRTLGDEIWATNAPRTIGELTGLLEPQALDELIVAVRAVAVRVVADPVLLELAGHLVEQFWGRHGERPLADLLADAGIDVEVVCGELDQFAPGVLSVLRDTGWLERRLRSRQAEFVAWYAGQGAKGR
jgi:hypothetical protein